MLLLRSADRDLDLFEVRSLLKNFDEAARVDDLCLDSFRSFGVFDFDFGLCDLVNNEDLSFDDFKYFDEDFEVVVISLLVFLIGACCEMFGSGSIIDSLISV